MTRTIGFVGLGNMGLPIAKRLLAAGHRVIAHDRREDLKAALDGAEWATSPRAVADRCALVMVCLPTPAVVEAVALGEDGLVRGTQLQVYVDLSTTGPQCAQAVAAALRSRGVVAIDAPVSGGVAGAVNGTLAIMVSGPAGHYADLEPVFKAFGGNVFHVGEQPGLGQVMKLVNNLLSTTALAATYEILTMGAKAGLDAKTMVDILSVSSGTNHAVESKIPRFLLQGKPMNFSLELSLKDVKLAVEAGEALGTPLRMGRITQAYWEESMRLHGPRQDYLQVVRVFEDQGGVRWSPPQGGPHEGR